MAAMVAIAHVLVVPTALRHDRRAAMTFCALSLLGLICVIVTLALRPRALFQAALCYVVVFFMAGARFAGATPNELRLPLRVGAGSAVMLIAVGAAWVLAWLPR